jgi:hypothetical protein
LLIHRRSNHYRVKLHLHLFGGAEVEQEQDEGFGIVHYSSSSGKFLSSVIVLKMTGLVVYTHFVVFVEITKFLFLRKYSLLPTPMPKFK